MPHPFSRGAHWSKGSGASRDIWQLVQDGRLEAQIISSRIAECFGASSSSKVLICGIGLASFLFVAASIYAQDLVQSMITSAVIALSPAFNSTSVLPSPTTPPLPKSSSHLVPHTHFMYFHQALQHRLPPSPARLSCSHLTSFACSNPHAAFFCAWWTSSAE
jgi:hypothetical protein